MSDMHVHIHFDGGQEVDYAPAKPPQVAETAAEEAAEEKAQAELAQRLDRLTAESKARMAAYEKELQQLQTVTRDHYKRMAKEAAAFRPRTHTNAYHEPSRTQAEDMDVGTETDQDKEYRLMRKYTDGETLTKEEFDFMRRRGCVRY